MNRNVLTKFSLASKPLNHMPRKLKRSKHVIKGNIELNILNRLNRIQQWIMKPLRSEKKEQICKQLKDYFPHSQKDQKTKGPRALNIYFLLFSVTTYIQF